MLINIIMIKQVIKNQLLITIIKKILRTVNKQWVYKRTKCKFQIKLKRIKIKINFKSIIYKKIYKCNKITLNPYKTIEHIKQ